MSSPFPGMDPYLESSRYWSDLHHELVSAIRAGIRPQLPQDFVARVEERVYIVDATVRPDVAILRRPTPNVPSGGTAVLDTPRSAGATDAPIHIRAFPETVREAFIEIVSVSEPGRVVTTIEVLSPANKRPGAGREAYLSKQDSMLQSQTHLLEIDFLRGGRHTLAAHWADILAQRERWDYLCCLHRAGWGNEFDVWPWTVRDSLPRITVPLTDAYTDLHLDLQAALERAWDAGGYAASINYAAEPDPPLHPQDAAWADALLRERKLRSQLVGRNARTGEEP